MALISTKGMYGLSAMYELFLADKNKPMQIKDIAQKANIPQSYLEQLLVILKKSQMIKSVRGVNGGYMLAKNPDDIYVKDIFLSLEGKIDIVDTVTSNDALNLFYKKSTADLHKIFDISLSQLHKNFYKNNIGQINYTTFGL
jgi:Rrf2 family protein